MQPCGSVRARGGIISNIACCRPQYPINFPLLIRAYQYTDNCSPDCHKSSIGSSVQTSRRQIDSLQQPIQQFPLTLPAKKKQNEKTSKHQKKKRRRRPRPTSTSQFRFNSRRHSLPFFVTSYELYHCNYLFFFCPQISL